MTDRAIVALSGYAGAGKDTLGELLVARGYRRAAFADLMRLSLLELDPHVFTTDRGWISLRVLVDALGWDHVKRHVPMARELLQRSGEGMKRALGDDVWTRAVLERIDGPTVITDCRFPVEAAAVEAAGGVVWRVERPGCSPVNGHKSETALDDWPFARRIDNDGTLEDLERRLDATLGEAACERRLALAGEDPLPFAETA